MIFFDVTKTADAGHRSGLTRVSSRLLAELGPAATPVRWPTWRHTARASDWFVTAELFSEAERAGLTAFLDARRCRTAAVFHDAIPLKHPHITWPHSVSRHPGYMKLLARFDRVFAVSETSRKELREFWRWQGLERTPPVDVLRLGADLDGLPRVTRRPAASWQPAGLLCVGIIEPRKNQAFLLDVAESLWRDGLKFELHLVGRVNPHFGPPVVTKVKQLAQKFPGAVRFHEKADDLMLSDLFGIARATVFPTIAEGCGLPLLESLWRGVPCVCSDLPVLRENADAGGCLPVPVNDADAWGAALRRVLADDSFVAQLAAEATARPLPTWADCARGLAAALAAPQA